MHYLYGSKQGGPLQLVATFDSDQQLRAYVRWATVEMKNNRTKFEQGSALAGFDAWEQATESFPNDDVAAVLHSPTPNMM